MKDTTKNNRLHSGELPGAKDKIDKTPSPGSPGMQILTRYSMTVHDLMKAVEVDQTSCGVESQCVPLGALNWQD